jgi:hypothetical protein
LLRKPLRLPRCLRRGGMSVMAGGYYRLCEHCTQQITAIGGVVTTPPRTLVL